MAEIREIGGEGVTASVDGHPVAAGNGKLMDRLGILGTVRASFALYNTKEEIDALVEGVRRVSKMF